MANRMNARQGFLRLTGCCFALALACFFAQPVSAATIHTGTYTENGNPDGNGDSFSVSNTGTEDIISLVIDLSTAASLNLIFDVVGGGSSAFTALNGPTVGYVAPAGVVDGGKTLILTFNSFNPGETFNFTIDIDDTVAGTTITNALILGTRITATSLADGPVSAFMGAGPPTGSWASPVPEPNTLALLGLGLTGLAWGSRRR